MEVELWKIIESRKLTLNHVLYEMQMYLATFPGCYSTSNTLVGNTFLESHQIHLRILTKFFTEDVKIQKDYYCDLIERNCPKKNKKNNDDDIKYFSILKEPPEDLKINNDIDAKKIINKTIAHLTQTRVKKDQIDDTAKMIDEMIIILTKRISLFIKLISDENNLMNAQLKSEIKITSIQEQIAEIKNRLEFIEQSYTNN